MEFPICEKHKKVEKTMHKVSTNAYVCMNRYCPDSYKVFCGNCKHDHRDHQMKLLTIQDTVFLLERLQKQPFKETNRYMMETLDVMKKLKLIKEFRKKIDILEKEIQKETLKLILNTEQIFEEYNYCREGANTLSEMFANIEKPDHYQHFFRNSQQMLSLMEYNFKKDKFQYGNTVTKEKQDKRKKTLDSTRRKVEEVRDYSMKIIEVILTDCGSDSEEEDISYLKKHYQVLRDQLSQQKNEEELEEEISELKNSKSTSNISRIKRPSCFDQESQTTDFVNIADVVTEYEEKIKDLQILHENNELNLQKELKSMSTEKQNLNKEINKWKQKYDSKQKAFTQIEKGLRQNKSQRQRKEKSREELVQKIMNLWQWKGLNSDSKAQ